MMMMIMSRNPVRHLRTPLCQLSAFSIARLSLPFRPSEGDCHLTEWSPWSSCQLMCLDGRGFETQGRQARSRAVIVQVPENQEACPSQVYETRPCKGMKVTRQIDPTPLPAGCLPGGVLQIQNGVERNTQMRGLQRHTSLCP